MWWMLLCRVIHPLGVQQLGVLARASGAVLDFVWVQKNLLLTDRTFRGMWCRADQQGVVRAWQRRIQSGSLGMVDRLLDLAKLSLTCVCCPDLRERVFVSAIGFFVEWRLEVVKCLTGREREGVDAVMPRNPPAWRSVAKGAVTSVRCLAGLWVGDFWSSKHVPYSEVLLGYTGPVEAVGTRPTGDCCCWRIEVGTLVLGRCLGLGNSSCWGTNGCLMKARPCVWLDPKGGMIARAVCPVSMCSASLLWIVLVGVEIEILVVGLLPYSNNNNNNNVHNIIGMNRDDAALVKSESSRTVC